MRKTLLTLTIATLLTGCNGDSSHKISNTSDPQLNYTVSGEVQSNYLSKEITVCADLTQDWICNPNEPKVKAKSGLFSITSINKNIMNARILAVSTLNAADDQSRAYTSKSVTLATPSLQKEKGNIINGISTLVTANMEHGFSAREAIRDVQAKLEKQGLSISGDLSDNFNDPALTQVDKNIQLLSASVKDEQRSRILSTLAKELHSQKDFIAADSLTEQEIADKAAQLEQQSLARLVGNDTGITQYFDGTDFTDTPQAGFPLQDADVGFDATDKNSHSGNGFKLTKLDAKGQALPDSAAEWSCVQDERTKLIWEVKSNDPTSPRWKKNEFALQIKGGIQPHSGDIEYSQQTNKSGINTTQQYQEMINKEQLCGINTWRLPLQQEQYDLLDLGSTAKNNEGDIIALNTKYFPNVEAGIEGFGWYWSSSLMYAENENQYYYNLYNYLDQVSSGGESGVQTLCKPESEVQTECESPTIMNIRMVSQGK
ncbi:Lcl C-terminal domain-containing protein [Photobacterium swingsii]|uniref:Lcl C-terminal domain-containing protein n=1 Tax=Photobacterium swingsii TaxID=680026 RepID=UPI004067E890